MARATGPTPSNIERSTLGIRSGVKNLPARPHDPDCLADTASLDDTAGREAGRDVRTGGLPSCFSGELSSMARRMQQNTIGDEIVAALPRSTAMNATTTRTAPQALRTTILLSTQVDGEACTVRATPIWPIAEVLDFDEAFDDLAAAGTDLDPGLVADAIESRMIASPRLRRRQKAVSSRAMFYAGG